MAMKLPDVDSGVGQSHNFNLHLTGVRLSLAAHPTNCV